MKRIIVLVLIVIVVIIVFSVGGSGEHYNTWTKEITCWDNCWHEIGHAIDHQSGWVSKTDEYREAVSGIIDKDKELSIVYTFNREFGLNTELYAEMLNIVDGNINKLPIDLHQFYNMELADKIMGELEDTKGVVCEKKDPHDYLFGWNDNTLEFGKTYKVLTIVGISGTEYKFYDTLSGWYSIPESIDYVIMCVSKEQ